MNLDRGCLKGPELVKFLQSLMWMDFNLIVGPNSEQRSDDPRDRFDSFLDAALVVLRSKKGSEPSSRLNRRTFFVHQLFCLYDEYKKVPAEAGSSSTYVPKTSEKRRLEGIKEAKLEELCRHIGGVKDWASSEGTMVSPPVVTPATYWHEGVPIESEAYSYALVFNSVVEQELWCKGVDDKWRKKSQDDQSPYK